MNTSELYESTNKVNVDESSMQEFKSIFKEDFHRLDLKIENVRLEVKESRNETPKWFIGLFIALALMILSLYLKK